VVRMAGENRDWLPSNRRALSNLGHETSRSTIAQILERHGIEPPRSGAGDDLKEFLADIGADCGYDFFTVEVWTARAARYVCSSSSCVREVRSGIVQVGRDCDEPDHANLTDGAGNPDWKTVLFTTDPLFTRILER